ncbi:heat shock protein Hsp20 domain-containing protein [Cavenderia fasciculata]|uniref:Heat shock protein Hsp20 domain-containing protein n=1 Tax=Cavenderia fasciculata TaxID=261658 RepID=F4Q3D2_CACFS|nr:heat shock protein Hsp20 domain-containing protein [Cavenderia fasciculata]EGG16801.1 heat shock protein Hsp20 domain-containing protein [Cavenderia fasciculata]|eukprot:XP_004355275.1 heat shock protein Hsp20 domain-containing protein [Cavenderia fasciculata]
MMNSWFMHPLEELSSLKHSIDETFRNWSGNMTSNSSQPMDWGWKPRMDVSESRNCYKVVLELPGFQKEDLDVQVNGRFLSIKGSKYTESKEGDWRFHRRERYSGGEFHRAVALPEGIDGSSIQAKFQGGILTLTIPKHGGNNAQHVSLLGSEEHASRRGVIEAEERERRRRMEEQDPMLSRNHWIASRMGTVIDEERERYRRMHQFDEFYEKQSNTNRRVTIQLENNERQRRIHDHRGEAEKKKNAMRVSKMIKTCGTTNPRSLLGKTNMRSRSQHTHKHSHSGRKQQQQNLGFTGKTNFGNKSAYSEMLPSNFGCYNKQAWKQCNDLENKERSERIRDISRQNCCKANAKRVSNMIKQGSTRIHLNHIPSSSTSKKVSISSSSSNNNNKSTMYYTKPAPSYFNNNKTGHFLNNLEEKERQRRLNDKRGQMEAKKNAAKIANMIGNASF